jgi:hypothetical protein
MPAVRFPPFAVLIALPLALSAAVVKPGDAGTAAAGTERAQASDADETP